MILYLINDDTLTHTKTLFVCQSEAEVLDKLSDTKNFKRFKGQIKIVKVVL